MQIPMIQVLEKMETEIKLAKQSTNDVLIKEKLAIIKALCEVALIESKKSSITQELEESIIEKEDHSSNSLLDF